MVDEAETALGRDLEIREAKLIGAMNIGAPKAFWQEHEGETAKLIDEVTAIAAHCPISETDKSLLKECAKLNRL